MNSTDSEHSGSIPGWISWVGVELVKRSYQAFAIEAELLQAPGWLLYLLLLVFFKLIFFSSSLDVTS